jgi:glycine hydroxymethyltransferase
VDGAREVTTAPWASPAARARLAAVEAALPADPEEALRAAAEAAATHVRRVEEEALLLYAGGNVPTPGAAALHLPLLGGQPSMGYPGDKYQAGLGDLDVVEVAVARAVAEVTGARFAEVRPPSATIANLAVYSALCEPGDAIAVLPDWAGGHLSHHEVGAAGIRGLRVAPLPYDLDELDVDLARLPAFLARERPRLVVVGASLMLRPHRLEEIAPAVHAAGATLLYDASHVAGLLAEGRFQAPLREGADLVTFSTYKSFGGPAGGVIACDDEALAARVAAAVYPGLTANYDLARLLPLGAAALEHRLSAGDYADRCIANARALAAALAEEGLAVLGAAHRYTSSHHVAVDVRALGGGTPCARRLAESSVLLSGIGCPTAAEDPDGAIRIGTQTVTRQGLGEDAMPAVAAALADALLARRPPGEVREAVAAIRRGARHPVAHGSTSPLS